MKHTTATTATMASSSDGTGDGAPPAKKMFALFQPGVRVSVAVWGDSQRVETDMTRTPTCQDTTSNGGTNASVSAVDPSSSSQTPASSTGKRSSRPRAVKDKPVKYSFAPAVDLTADDEGQTDDQAGASASSSKSKRQRRNSPLAAPPVPAPAPYLPPLTLNVKGTGVQSEQPAHSFFAKRTFKPAAAESSLAVTTARDPQQRIKRSKIPPSLPLFPTAQSQHVRPLSATTDDLQVSLRSLDLPFASAPASADKGKEKQRDTGDDLSLPQSGLTHQVRASASHNGQPSRHSTRKTDAQAIVADLAHLTSSSPHAPLAAFQAIASSPTDPTQKSSSLWTHRWRPRRADQVLANTEAATYLSSWLRVLQITSKKADVAGVDQTSKKAFRHGGQTDHQRTSSDSEAAFDAEDAELLAFFQQFTSRSAKSSTRRRPSTIPDDEDEVEDGGDQSAQHQPQTQPTQPALDFDPTHDLSNAILLVGPSGSCKTATVYACAEELGYEVFELYPGMGRRSKGDLLSAVGDLGRNHMVSSGGGSAGGSSAFSAMMKASSAQHTQDRQSLILIEEVDVLSRDDVMFWSGVRDLMKTSRRPVVMTCNDADFVPLDDLVLQEVLSFKRVTRDVAAEYLRFVAAAEGYGIVDAGRCVGASDDDGGVDLRQAITQLQFSGGMMGDSARVLPIAAWPDGISAPSLADTANPQTHLSALRQASKLLSHLSTLTSTLIRPHVRQAGIDDPPQREAGADDLILPSNWRALYAQVAEGEARVVLPSSGKEDDVSEEFERLVKSVGVIEGIDELLLSPSWEHNFQRDLTAQVDHLWTMLNPQVRSTKDQYTSLASLHSDVTTPRISSHAQFALHYAPSLRHIVAIEDFEEALNILDLHQRKATFLQDLQQAANGRGRMTRNSTGLLQQQFTRVYDLEKQVLQATRKSGAAFICARREFYRRQDDNEQETNAVTGSTQAIVVNVLADVVTHEGEGGTSAAPLPGEARREIKAKLGCE